MAILLLVPPLLYLTWIRRAERYQREPWGHLLRVFVGGAVVAVLISIVLEYYAFAGYGFLAREYVLLGTDFRTETVVLVCIIAPFVEEMAKGLIVGWKRRWLLEVEDGLVYGAASGLGFATTENLLYGLAAMLEFGVGGFVGTVFIRSISSVFLHASATAITGYGISRKTLGVGSSALPYFFAAVSLHGIFNLVASLQVLFGPEYGLLSLLLAVAIGVTAIRRARKKIVELDRHAPATKRYRKLTR